jgi:hypothetical protein
MALRVERTEYDPESGYLYYVFFNLIGNFRPMK